MRTARDTRIMSRDPAKKNSSRKRKRMEGFWQPDSSMGMPVRLRPKYVHAMPYARAQIIETYTIDEEYHYLTSVPVGDINKYRRSKSGTIQTRASHQFFQEPRYMSDEPVAPSIILPSRPPCARKIIVSGIIVNNDIKAQEARENVVEENEDKIRKSNLKSYSKKKNNVHRII
mmetsp:Transcript_15598/g.17337  ORF Transcript_15598/g.17337 Transcript_15598/m.17337 type:complete len:173 (+) Transcript_15598:79-597(+)